MKERPILFSAPMVRAILDGRKTQTRRVVKPQPPIDTISYVMDGGGSGQAMYFEPSVTGGTRGSNWHLNPYGKPGDRLWVKETFSIEAGGPGTWLPDADVGKLHYFADGGHPPIAPHPHGVKTGRWKPSIFMPRVASRITLEITDIRVQRLQGISNEDAEAEGIEFAAPHRGATCGRADTGIDQCYVCEFLSLWNSINGKTHPWDSNPWLWCVSFKRVSA